MKTNAAIDGTPLQIPTFLPLTFTLGSRSHKMLFSTLYIMSHMHLQSLKLLHSTVQEKMHLQENTLFDLDFGVKVSQRERSGSVVECSHGSRLRGRGYIQQLRRRCINQKNTLLTSWPLCQGHIKCCPVPSTSCLGGDAFT